MRQSAGAPVLLETNTISARPPALGRPLRAALEVNCCGLVPSALTTNRSAVPTPEPVQDPSVRINSTRRRPRLYGRQLNGSIRTGIGVSHTPELV